MQENLLAKEQTIKEMEKEKRDGMGAANSSSRKIMDNLLMEIARLKETIMILQQQLSKHKSSEAMGYF